MVDRVLDPSTVLLHPEFGRGGTQPEPGLSPSLERSSTFRLDRDAEEALATREGTDRFDIYGRFGTSTTRVAGRLVARLEGGDEAVLFASGMAAIDTTFRALVPAGGKIAVSHDVYGGTEHLLEHDLGDRGVQVRRFDATDAATLATVIADGFRPDLVWCESISNPLLRVADLAEIARVCGEAKARLGVDATFAGGMAHHPLALGADVVVHSATKYLNGHSDVIAGVACARGDVAQTIHHTMTRLGGCIDPMGAWLLARGIRTLPVRWARQCDTAARLATSLAEHPAVVRVAYPDAAAVKRGGLTSGGAMVSFEVADADAANAVVWNLGLVAHAVSLGGVETLITMPRRSSHVGRNAEHWESVGIREGLLRLSVGLESFEDLWSDLRAGLDQAAR